MIIRRTLLTLAACTGLMAATVVDTGCRPKAPDPGGTETDSDSSSTSVDSEGTTGVDTTAGPTTLTTSTSDATNTTCGFLTCDGTTTTATNSGGGPLPNGSTCMADSECESMMCYEIPMVAGFCSECKSDSDCPEDAPSCSLDFLQMQAVCKPIALGVMCENQATCDPDYYCASILPGLEIFLPLVQTCGECSSDGNCADGEFCNPLLNIETFSGYTECVAPGEVPNDALCNGNDEVCMSGHCNETPLEGIPLPLMINLCGECGSDADCEMGQTCMDGAVDIMGGGLSGSTCV